jgi:predicted MFS family arabinose efflux permease
MLRAARIAISALFFINGFAFATWVSRIPGVQEALGLSAASLGAALAGIGAGSLMGMPMTGWLIPRYGSRPVVWTTTIASAATLLLPALASDAIVLGVALALFGASLGSMDVAMNAQGVELEQRYGSPIMSTFHALWSLGGMSGAGLGGMIAAAGAGVAIHFASVALALLVLTAVVLPRLIRAPPTPHATAGRLRVSRTLVTLSLLAVCIMVSEGAMADWTSVYLASELGAGPGLAAAGFAVFSGAMTAGRLGGDWMTSRIGRVKIVRIGAVLAACGLAAALVVETVPAALAGFLCVGAGLSVIIPLVFSAAGRLDSRSAGSGLAVVTTAGYFGFLAGPPVIGFAAEQISLPGALGLVVALAGAGALLAGSVSASAQAHDAERSEPREPDRHAPPSR